MAAKRYIFSAVYRVESRAWFAILAPWLYETLHDDVHGGRAHHECMEASWDAQADLEAAMLSQSAVVFASYDLMKFFDSFAVIDDHNFRGTLDDIKAPYAFIADFTYTAT